MTNKEPILERIRKLLNLSSSTNVHEAASAAAFASKLMLEHKLEMSDVNIPAEQVEEVEEMTFRETGKKLVHWRSNLMHALALNNFCDMITAWTRGEKGQIRCYKLFGKRSDIDAVQYLFAYLCAEIDRLAAQYAVEEVAYMAREEKQLWAPGKAWYTSFRLGAVTEISNRLYADRKSTEDSFKTAANLGLTKAGNALIVINSSRTELEAFKHKLYPKLRANRSARVSNRDAYSTGREAGRTVKLPGGDKALGAEPRRLGD